MGVGLEVSVFGWSSNLGTYCFSPSAENGLVSFPSYEFVQAAQTSAPINQSGNILCVITIMGFTDYMTCFQCV